MLTLRHQIGVRMADGATRTAEPGSADTDSVESAELRYARTGDGVTIAYQLFGQGPAMVWLPSLSHVVAQWRVPLLREVYRRLAGSMTVLLYDGRGTGSSDRRVDLDDLGLDAHLRDLRAVVEAAGLERPALFGPLPLGRDRDRVRRRPSGAGQPDAALRRGRPDARRDEPGTDRGPALPGGPGLGPVRRLGGVGLAGLGRGGVGPVDRRAVPDRDHPGRGAGVVRGRRRDRRDRGAGPGRCRPCSSTTSTATWPW
jgi:hypothetical protein